MHRHARTPSLLLALCTAVALAGCDAVRPFEAVCERRLGPTSVHVTTTPVSYTTDFSRSIDDLTARGAHSAGTIVLGLVETQVRSEAKFGLNGIKQSFRDRYCMRPSVDVRLAFAPMRLFVAREHPEGSCGFRVTMEHELKHIAVYQEYLADFAAQIQVDLGHELGDRILYFASPAAADTHVEAVIAQTLQPYLEGVREEVEARQKRVDSPEEYARLSAMQNWCARR
ncbi:MAG: hypothetical protein IT515_03275 [Burkholderiales bacterium]|nr:hypothetical protein [Burkholderiales bacterium]